jgi:hypothetical protein
MGEPAVCGDHIFIYYYMENRDDKTASATFMHVID